MGWGYRVGKPSNPSIGLHPGVGDGPGVSWNGRLASCEFLRSDDEDAQRRRIVLHIGLGNTLRDNFQSSEGSTLGRR